MSTYVALLRGINVTGYRKLPMKDLRGLMEELGYGGVRTYIQSGNVVFEARRRGSHGERISEGIAARFGYDDVPVVVVSARALREIHEANPFDVDGADPKRVHVGFLEAPPGAEGVARLEAVDAGPDDVVITPRAVYVRYEGSSARSKVSNQVIERRLGVRSTLRNLRTVRKLVEMADE